MFRTKPLTLLAITVLAAVSMSIAWGASPAATTTPATVQVNYFANANTAGAPDGTVEMTNPGTSGGSANICAMIYVFEPDEELAECCGCTLTPNDLRTLSINNNLTANPLTGTVLSGSGTISIVAATDTTGTCNPAAAYTPTPTTLDWGTHIITVSTGGYVITETAFQSAGLGETSTLIGDCAAIVREGSGHGICNCGVGE
jgi:hypothetical protein